MTNFRFVLAVISVPTLTAIFGLLWLWDKKKKKKINNSKKRRALEPDDSTDEGLSQWNDCHAGNDSRSGGGGHPNQCETVVDDRRKAWNDGGYDNDDDGDGGDDDDVTLLPDVEDVLKKGSNLLTNSSCPTPGGRKLKHEEIRRLNGRRGVSPGQHVDSCIVTGATAAGDGDGGALHCQAPGKHSDTSGAPPPGGTEDGGGGGESNVAGCNSADATGGLRHLTGVHLGHDGACSEPEVGRVACATVAAVRSATDSNDDDAYGKKKDDEGEVEEEVVTAGVARVQECEAGRRREGSPCVSAAVSGADNLLSATAPSWGSGTWGSELSDTWGTSSGISEIIGSNKAGCHGDGGGGDVDLSWSDVQVSGGSSSNNTTLDWVTNDPAEVEGPRRRRGGDKVDVESYDQVRSLDAISAVFSSDPLNDSELKGELECLRGGGRHPVTSTTTNTSTPKREGGAILLLQSAKELFHETTSITPPETESEKDVLTESLESDPVVGDDDDESGGDVSTSEGAQSDVGADVYLSSLSQSQSAGQRTRENAAENSTNKSLNDITFLSSPENATNTTTASFETALDRFEGSGVDVVVAGSEPDNSVERLETVDSLGSECPSSESVRNSTGEVVRSSGDHRCRSVEVYGSSFQPAGIGGAVDNTSSLGSSDQDGEEATAWCERQPQSGDEEAGLATTTTTECDGDRSGHDQPSSDSYVKTSSDSYVKTSSDSYVKPSSDSYVKPSSDSYAAVTATATVVSSNVCGEVSVTGYTGSTSLQEAEEAEVEEEMLYSNNNPVDNSANCDATDSRCCFPEDGVSGTIQASSGSKLEYNGATFSPESNFHSNSPASCDFTNVPQCDNNMTIPSSKTLYEFYFPSDLCGRLIGRQGKTISQIKERSGAYLTLQPSPYTPNHQICSIDGSEEEIQEALKCITEKFPPSVYGNVDLTPIRDASQLASNPVVMPDLIQLNFPQEGVSVNVLVASIIDAGHLFLQLPTHPTYVALNRLNKFMNRCYSQPGMVPHLPRPLAVGVICAAPAMDSWYRAVIVAVSEETDECEIKFVDYGGYSQVLWNDLRQIRSDFMTLPFQAIEAYLANITPLPDEPYFSDAAVETLQQLTESGILQAQVVSRADDGTPYVHIYQINGNKVSFINRELVNRNVVQWIEIL